MIVVYWLEGSGTPQARSAHAVFDATDLSPALKFAESLRARRKAGEPISHVTLQSELPESVGTAGVGDAPADYAHYKRRLDPSVPLGRPSGTPPKD